jgi:hypothetical protein
MAEFDTTGGLRHLRYIRALFELSEAYPDWTIEQYYTEARRRLHLT